MNDRMRDAVFLYDPHNMAWRDGYKEVGRGIGSEIGQKMQVTINCCGWVVGWRRCCRTLEEVLAAVAVAFASELKSGAIVHYINERARAAFFPILPNLEVRFRQWPHCPLALSDYLCSARNFGPVIMLSIGGRLLDLKKFCGRFDAFISVISATGSGFVMSWEKCDSAGCRSWSRSWMRELHLRFPHRRTRGGDGGATLKRGRNGSKCNPVNFVKWPLPILLPTS